MKNGRLNEEVATTLAPGLVPQQENNVSFDRDDLLDLGLVPLGGQCAGFYPRGRGAGALPPVGRRPGRIKL